MKKSDLKLKRKLSMLHSEYGYTALNDLGEMERLKNLNKIIKLKTINRNLSNQRYNIYVKLRSYDPTTLGFMKYTNAFMVISEKIGGNGLKIKQLRAKYYQVKASAERFKLKLNEPKDFVY